MYLDHFSLKERPFSISPDPRFLFMSNRYREALAHLTYGVEDGGGFVLLTGEVGTGKTTVCRCLLQQLPDKTRLAFVLNPKLNSLELMATICDELKIEYPENCDSLKILTDKLSEYLLRCYQDGLSVVVMIDEAQNIDTEVLEQIRLLTNLETNQKKLLQIILVGQPELQEKLASRELRQLAQRITARYHLRPLNLKETMAYVLHRVRIAGSKKSLFNRQAIELLHTKTAGIPRLINTICDRSLVAAASRKALIVGPKIMKEAIGDVMGEPQKNAVQSIPRNYHWSSKLALLLIGVGILFGTYWLGKSSQNNVTATTQIEQQNINPNNIDKNKTNSITDSSKTSIKAKVDSATTLAMNESETHISLVEKMLGKERWDSNGYWSMQSLLSLWQLDYSAFKDGSACEFAASYGLLCEQGLGNWQQLRRLNRPVNLKFTAGLQGEFWGTLKNISGTQAQLVFGEREVNLRLDELSSVWTGQYQLVWQAPNGFEGAIKRGDQGEAVAWLSQKMKQLVNSSLEVNNLFSNELQSALQTYQTKRQIRADGIAGMQTILMINSETLKGIPLLSKSVSSELYN